MTVAFDDAKRRITNFEKVNAMRVGMVGWRGMVGSVLMQRMTEEGDFELIEPTFFSTSAARAFSGET